MFEADGCSRRRGGWRRATHSALCSRRQRVSRKGYCLVEPPNRLRASFAARHQPPRCRRGRQRGSTRDSSRREVVRGGGAAGAVRLTPRGNSRRQGMSRKGSCLVEPPNKFRASFAARVLPPCGWRGRRRERKYAGLFEAGGCSRRVKQRWFVRGGRLFEAVLSTFSSGEGAERSEGGRGVCLEAAEMP